MSSISICEIVAALMKAPRTRDELAEYIGCTGCTAKRLINVMRRSGIVYITELRARERGEDGSVPPGPHIPVYRLQPMPHEIADMKSQRSKRRRPSEIGG